MNDRRISKFISLVLRHQPEKIQLELDPAGWLRVDDLIRHSAQFAKINFSREDLDRIVAEDSKGRYSYSEDGTRIRANQGHSVEVNLGLQPVNPPEHLYHGTVERFLPAIAEKGLLKMSRQHVHLSAELETATQVGGRRGKPVILTVEARKMSEAGHPFFLSENGVWLTETVPPEFISGL